MRATSVFLLVIVGAPAAEAAPPELTPTGELEPRGACVTYMDFTHAVRGSAPDGLADSIMTMNYDSAGRLVAERWWRMDTPVRVVSHSYDSLGRRKRTTWRLTDKKLVLTIEYRYTRAGDLSAEITRYPNGQRWKNTRRYDRQGRLSLSRESGESGTMMSRWFSYKDDRISEERLDRTGNGKVDERTSYSYDAQGRLTGKVRKLKGDYAEQHISFTYDENDQLIERRNTHIWPTRPKWNGPREIMTYSYDKAGNLIMTEQRVTETTDVTVRWIYDYSCHEGTDATHSMPAAKCRSSYPKCGVPWPPKPTDGMKQDVRPGVSETRR